MLSYNGLDAVFIRELLAYLIDERGLRIGRLVIEAYSINAVSASGLRDYRLFNDAPPALETTFSVSSEIGEGALRTGAGSMSSSSSAATNSCSLRLC